LYNAGVGAIMAKIREVLHRGAGARPLWSSVQRADESDATVLIMPALGRRGFLDHLRAYAIGMAACVGVWILTLIVIDPREFAKATTWVFIALMPAGAAPLVLWAWFKCSIEVHIRIEENFLSYRFGSFCWSVERRWSREEVTAIRWDGWRMIRVFGTRGQIIGRILPLSLAESQVGHLSRLVRTQFGF
jgi:hypothetical protein